MTEAEWVVATDPQPMLRFVQDKASDRQLRLFACAYARTGSWLEEFSKLCFEHFYEGWGRQRPAINTDAALEALLSLRQERSSGTTTLTFRGMPPRGEHGEQLVALAEQSAEGLCSIQGLEAARTQIEPEFRKQRTGAAYCGPSAFRPVEEYMMLLATLAPTGWDAAQQAIASVEHIFVAVADSGPRRRLNGEFRRPLQEQTFHLQADLLREIFGNPFRTNKIESAWRSTTVLRLARTIYEQRSFEVLPILGDALEDAGCSDHDTLTHCRNVNSHVLGCWVVDNLLSKT